MKPLAPYLPGQRSLSADGLNARLAELLRQGRTQLLGGTLDTQAGGQLLTVQRPERYVWAEITGGSNPYSWRELRPAAAGTWTVKTLGRTGTTARHPAYDINGNRAVPTGTSVKLRRGRARIVGGDLSQEWLFDYCCQQPGTDFPVSGGSGVSGSGLHDGRLYGYFLPCCPTTLLPDTLYLTITSIIPSSSSSGGLYCLIGKPLPMAHDAGSPVTVNDDRYFVDDSGQALTGIEPYWGCDLGLAVTLLFSLGCDSTTGDLVATMVYADAISNGFNYNVAVRFAPGTFCRSPFYLFGEFVLPGANPPINPDIHVLFTISE